ncbi:hypothetical protein SCALM49S_00386 [Streptomyces californicus]
MVSVQPHGRTPRHRTGDVLQSDQVLLGPGVHGPTAEEGAGRYVTVSVGCPGRAATGQAERQVQLALPFGRIVLDPREAEIRVGQGSLGKVLTASDTLASGMRVPSRGTPSLLTSWSKGYVLAVQHLRGLVPGAGYQRGHVAGPGQADPGERRVHEETHGPLVLGAYPPGHRYGDHQVLRTADPMQQDGERGQREGQPGVTTLGTRSGERRAQPRRQGQRDVVSVVVFVDGSRSDGQRQLLRPVGEAAGDPVGLRRPSGRLGAAFPADVVAEAVGRGAGARLARRDPAVCVEEVLPQERQAPAVAHDVMHDQVESR